MGARKTCPGWVRAGQGKGLGSAHRVPHPECEAAEPRTKPAVCCPLTPAGEQEGKEGGEPLLPGPATGARRTRRRGCKPPDPPTGHGAKPQTQVARSATPPVGRAEVGREEGIASIRASSSLTLRTGSHQAVSPPLGKRGSRGKEVTDSPSGGRGGCGT